MTAIFNKIRLNITLARNAQEIADLFLQYFQGVFVEDDSVEDSSTVSLIQLEEETVEQGILD
jgi:hypothetical protein